jgi:hypothetical protein
MWGVHASCTPLKGISLLLSTGREKQSRAREQGRNNFMLHAM